MQGIRSERRIRIDEVTPMRLLPRALREMTVTYSRSDLVAVSLVAAVVAVWAAVAGGAFSFRALVCLRGDILRILPRRLALRGLSVSGSGRSLRSSAAFAHWIRRRQHGSARARLAFAARHRRELWHLARDRDIRVFCDSRTQASRGKFRESLGRRYLRCRHHTVVPGLDPPDFGSR